MKKEKERKYEVEKALQDQPRPTAGVSLPYVTPNISMYEVSLL